MSERNREAAVKRAPERLDVGGIGNHDVLEVVHAFGVVIGETAGGLVALGITADVMPPPEAPRGTQVDLFE